ncbi:CocE/NonD family hydrolase [Streptomyces fructofermentans]|uniref:CocE/NonD family hydrolase n=1 Tax=Streptomyces fructofermentans TaxID=152141 RepID=UPI0033F9F682
MRIRTSFPHDTAHEDLRVPLSDGTKLHARVWRPLTGEPVPALLEYDPYRLSDWTAPRDAQRHPWYAGHGYASVRVDMRGHGNSEGVPDGAHHAEAADGAEVVDWLAAQPWCTGAVGMFGIARGALAALRVAALAPGPLKAVVAVCATDGTHGDPGHREGSAPDAGPLAGTATALAYAARPPDPAYTGEDGNTLWVRRLRAVVPPSHEWAADQAHGRHRRHGAVPEDCAAVRAAVLAVGGGHDPYRDTVLRLVEHLPPDRVRGLIGPWAHQYPDRGRSPGPAIGFLQETLRWWDHWLRGTPGTAPGGTPRGAGGGADSGSRAGTEGGSDDVARGADRADSGEAQSASADWADWADDRIGAHGTGGVMSTPLLRSYIADSHPPATPMPTPTGRWVGDPSWPSPLVAPVAYVLRGRPVAVRSPQHTGIDAGAFPPVGGDADLPPDQREEDARSACFEFEVPEEIWVLGRPRVRLRLTARAARGQVAARLCDVAPDGASTLVTRGVLDLPARRGADRDDALDPDDTEDVVLDLHAVGHAFPPGHRIRLAVSSAYWPRVWPQPGSGAGFTLTPTGSLLELPLRAQESDPSITFGEPEQAEPMGVNTPATLDEPRPERLVVHDVAKGEWRLETDPCPGGTRVYPDGLEVTEDAGEAYTIGSADPLSACVRSHSSIRLHRPDLPWDARIEARSQITCDEADFITFDELVCKSGDEVVFHRTWEKRIPRASG